MADRSVRVRLEAITTNFNRRISESAVLTRQFSRELESADGRMANIVQTGLALAPALVPIGAVGIPAVAGLTAQLGFATLGLGAMVLGLHGVGDALDALDKFQLEPTADHLQKVEETLKKLGPAGGEFVLFLDQVEPKLHRLQALAEQGLLPGVEDGLRDVLHLMPELRQLVFGVSSTVGDLIREAGDNLDDPRWKAFFGFLETRARPTLTDMGHTAGNFAEAFANLVMDFDPLERDFSRGLVHMSQQVRDWSDGLDKTQGFQNLVVYIRENGPKVLDTLGATADAFIQIVEAAAPVGSAVLPVLTDVLHVVSAVADTPAGSVLVGIAAAVGLLGRSLALLKVIGLRGESDSVISRALGVKEIKGIPEEYRKVAVATDELRVAQEAAAAAAVRARDAQFGLVPTAQQRAAVTEYATAQDRVRQAEERLAAAQRSRSAALRETLATAGKAGAVVGGLAVAETGVADKMGLTNTATLALMGSIAGGPGVIAGGLIGLTLDLVHANDGLEDSIRRVNAAAETANFAQWRKDLNDLVATSKSIQKAQAAPPPSFLTDPLGFTTHGFGELSTGVQHVFGQDQAADAKKAAEEQAAAFDTVRKNAVDLFNVLENANPKGLKVTDDELTAFITKISPALQRAGVNIADLLQHRTGWVDAQMAVHDWVTQMDSAKGRSEAVADALAGLEDQITPTVDAAQQLATALDALFGPELSQAEAIDRWFASLHNLRDELKKNGAEIDGHSKKALANKSAIRDSAQALENRAKADAAAGASAEKITAELKAGRDAIIEQAVAAGASKTKVSKYLDDIGLSMRNLNTIIDRVNTKLHKLSDWLIGLKDKTVTVKVRQIMELNNAHGGIYTYAQGDVANRHMPELAGPGPTRIWREPETKGEAYIPLANDFRRPRAIDIWERTGMALGVQFRRYAFGGGTGLPSGGELRLSEGDIGRLTRAMLAARPAVAQQTVMPHNYSEFRRQQEANERAAAGGGAPQ